MCPKIKLRAKVKTLPPHVPERDGQWEDEVETQTSTEVHRGPSDVGVGPWGWSRRRFETGRHTELLLADPCLGGRRGGQHTVVRQVSEGPGVIEVDVLLSS